MEVNNNLSEYSSSSTNSTSSPSKTMVHYQGDDAKLWHIDAIEEIKKSTTFSNGGICINNNRMLDAIATTQEEKLQNLQKMLCKLSSIIEVSPPSDDDKRSTNSNYDDKEKYNIIVNTFLTNEEQKKFVGFI